MHSSASKTFLTIRGCSWLIQIPLSNQPIIFGFPIRLFIFYFFFAFRSFFPLSLLKQRMAEEQPMYSPFFGVMGATSAMVFSAMGAAYGTAKSGTGIAAMSVMRPELIMKSIIPVVMAGIIAIYGVVVAVLISGQLGEAPGYTLYK